VTDQRTADRKLSDTEPTPTLVQDGEEEKEEVMAERFTLPVLPLRDTVV
jgi:hypothetical protein